MKPTALTHKPSRYSHAGVALPLSCPRPVFFDGRLPDFAQARLQAFCKTPLGKALVETQEVRQIHTYAVVNDRQANTLLFFQHEKNKIIVLNGHDTLDAQATQQFTHTLFQRFPKVHRIYFRSAQSFMQKRSGFLRSKLKANQTRVILPPAPSPQMEQALRFNRRNIRYFLQRLKKDYPDFHFKFQADESIEETKCREVLQLNRLRLASHNSAAPDKAEEDEKLIASVRKSGLVGTITIRDKVVAGVICHRIGQDYYLHTLAHDPRYQAYGLSMLSTYFTLCACLDKRSHANSTRKSALAYRLTLVQQQVLFNSLTIRRPHASWMVRCDYALYTGVMNKVYAVMHLHEECMQVGKAFVRLVGAWRILLQTAKKRCTGFAGREALSSLLRGQ